MQFIETLENWALVNASNLQERGLTIDFVRDRVTDKPSSYLDIDTAQTLARIIVWSSGELHLEALEAGSGKQLIVEVHTAGNSEELIDLIEAFVSRLT